MRAAIVILALLLAAAVGATLIARAGATAPSAFRTPDAGAACRLEGTSIVCSTLASKGSIALGQRGPARVVRRLPWWDASTPVLRKTWRDGTITCKLASGAIVCSNGRTSLSVSNRGFAVAS